MGIQKSISLPGMQKKFSTYLERKSSWYSLILLFTVAGVVFSCYPRISIAILGAFLVGAVTLKNPVNGLVLLLIGMQFIEKLTVIPLGTGIPNLSFSRLMISVLVLALVVKRLSGEFKYIRAGLVELSILATVIGIVLAAPKSIDPTSVLQTAVTMHLIPLLMYPLARNLVQSRRDLHKVLTAIVIFGTLVSLYAIFEIVTDKILFFPGDADLANLRTTFTPFGDLQQLRGLMGSPGNFGRILVVSIPVTLYLFLEQNKSLNKRLQIVSLIIQFVGLYLSLNRSSWISLIVGLFIFQVFDKKFRPFLWVSLLVGLLLFTAFSASILDSKIGEERLLRRIDDLGGRIPRWQTGFNMWKEEPILGWGFGRFALNSGGFRPDGNQQNLKAVENDYLFILVGAGIVGFLPYLFYLLIPLFFSLRLFKRARSPSWDGFINAKTIVLYWVVTLGFLMTSMSAVQTKSIIKISVFVIAGAIIGSQQHLQKSDESKDSSHSLEEVV